MKSDRNLSVHFNSYQGGELSNNKDLKQLTDNDTTSVRFNNIKQMISTTNNRDLGVAADAAAEMELRDLDFLV